MRSRAVVGLVVGVTVAVAAQGLAQDVGGHAAEQVGHDGPRMRAGPRSGMGGMFEGREGRPGGPGGLGAGLGEGGEAMIARLLTNPKVVDELGLSTGQVATLREKLEGMRKEMETLRTDLEKVSMEQARLLATQTVDEAAVMTAVEKAGEVRTKIAKIMVQQLLVVKKTLTPEQIEKARGMVRERMGKERGRFMNSRGDGAGPGQWRRPRERGAEGEGESRPPAGEGSKPPPPPPEQAL